ncbi:Probable ABC transporter, permease protein [Mycobacteroides abscessus subsp. abscessus]|nr:Probable ABC transporter, permease protein [Mycobacteroides abscessus subsp. abscessus]
MIVAVKNLVAERARFVLSVVGVAVAVILVLVMSGIFVGTTNQVTTYIRVFHRCSGPSRGFRRRAKTGC